MRIVSLIVALATIQVIALVLSPAGAQTFGDPADSRQAMIYTLDVALGWPKAIDVDEFGRPCILDHGRQALMRFSATGKLQRSWPEGVHGSFFPIGRPDFCVLPGERMLLSPGGMQNNTRRIGPDVDALYPHDAPQGVDFAAASDGSYYVLTVSYNAKHEPIRWVVYAYGPDGSPRANWKTGRADAMAIGPDDLLYLARDDYKITVYGQTGAVQREIDISGAYENARSLPEGVRSPIPNELAIDTNGDIYMLSSEITRLSRDGRLIARWRMHMPEGSECMQYTVPDIGVNNGLVYVLVTGKIATEQQKPIHLQFDNGKPTAADWQAICQSQLGQDEVPFTEVQAYSAGGQCVARYVSPAPLMCMPSSLAVQSDGSCAVVRGGWRSTIMVDAKGEPLNTFKVGAHCVAPAKGGGFFLADSLFLAHVSSDCATARLAYMEDTFETPPGKVTTMVWQIAANPANGDIWGLGGAGTIYHFNPQGELIKRFPKKRVLNFSLWAAGMAVDPNGYLWLPDPQGHRIVKVGFDGKIAGEIGKEGPGLGELRYPEDVLVDRSGNLVVADTGNSRIQFFSPTGDPLGFWGAYGYGDGELNQPAGIALGPNDTLWIADTQNDRIVKLSLAGGVPKLLKEPPPKKPAPAKRAKIARPAGGSISITGCVTAGSDDLKGDIYAQDLDSAWGIRVTLPNDVMVNRDDYCKFTGSYDSASRHFTASSVAKLQGQGLPDLIAMADMYVGDACQQADAPAARSTLYLLVKAWGEVESVDPANATFVISDGSLEGGLLVSAKSLRTPISNWPAVGEWVCVTGISITATDAQGVKRPALQLRNQADIAK